MSIPSKNGNATIGVCCGAQPENDRIVTNPAGDRLSFDRKFILITEEIIYMFAYTPTKLIFLLFPIIIVMILPGLIRSPALAVDIGMDVFASGFTNPVSISHTSDDRLFVVEKAGQIKIVEPSGIVLDPPFLSIAAKVGSQGGEQGLLGLAFHPEYASNGYFYVNYTNLSGTTVVSRFSVSSDPDSADLGSEQILLTIPQPFDNHNGGDLHFGPDGYLYIFTGDGGSGGDPDNNAQNPQSLLGKILRIDVNQGLPYSIPPDNPFVSDPNVLDEIWALGLRNPWRTSFDRLTGDLWIADVGQSAREEINVEAAGSPGGANYGWRCYEGNLDYNTSGCDAPENYIFPVFDYAHPPHCAVTGGYVYRGAMYPGLYGRYLLTDYCTGNVWSLYPDGMGGYEVTDFGVRVTFISSFGENMDGELFACSLLDGNVYQIMDSESAATPTPTRTASPTASPTPAATPTPGGCYVDLDLSQETFQGGDPFTLTYLIGNPEPQTVSGNFWLLLDVYGLYWFYPDWIQTPEYMDVTLMPGASFGPNTALDFSWPADVGGHAENLMFICALTDSSNTALKSNVASVTFGY